jgi:hypothetical protein
MQNEELTKEVPDSYYRYSISGVINCIFIYVPYEYFSGYLSTSRYLLTENKLNIKSLRIYNGYPDGNHCRRVLELRFNDTSMLRIVEGSEGFV